MIKQFIKKYLLQISGIIVGMIAGYLYYHYIGCKSGTCPITSNPYISIVYGAVLGYLVFDLFKPKKQNKKTES